MSGKILKRLWAVCLIAGGVCAVVIGILNIMGVKPAKVLTPVLCVLLLSAIAGIFILTAQMMKRQKKK